MSFVRPIGRVLAATGFAALLAAGSPALAQTKWDISLPWGPSEFHTLNAIKFAEEVKKVTNGEVQMTVHPGSALGVRANESVRALQDGVVPMAEYAAFQNTGELDLLGVEALPFLVANYDELRVMLGIARQPWSDALARKSQKVLYMVPWPSQNFFLKREVRSFEDLKGVKMRVYDKNSSDMVTALSMVPQQLNNPDVVPALASGRADGVMTSGTTAVAQKYWEFLSHAYNTNHLWALNFMAVNLDAWKKLKPEHQKAIEELAQKMEPSFWEVSQKEHDVRIAELQKNGMKYAVAPKDMVDRMRQATAVTWDNYTKLGPVHAKIVADYRAKTGK
ncbi:MAG: TRAP transporter substrate-binding protein [Alphaproteobacteria bacterium]|nr:TRAP transporter substrate-binding protein [Alphaproteobacteria bacterium]